MTEQKTLNERVSSLLDKDFDGSEDEDVINNMCQDDGMKRSWEHYHLISDALKHNLPRHINSNLARRVMQALESEPTILAPRRFTLNMSPVVKQIMGLSIAASVTAIAILGIQFMSKGTSGPFTATQIANMPTSQEFTRVKNTDYASQSARKALHPQINKFVVNHNQRFGTSINGVLPYARIVAHSSSRQTGNNE